MTFPTPTSTAYLPAALCTHNNFLCRQLTPGDDGALRKLPYNPTTGRPASCSDPSTWVDYATARAGLESGLYDSIGIALTKPFGWAIVDFDKVRESAEDRFPKWVLDELPHAHNRDKSGGWRSTPIGAFERYRVCRTFKPLLDQSLAGSSPR